MIGLGTRSAESECAVGDAARHGCERPACARSERERTPDSPRYVSGTGSGCCCEDARVVIVSVAGRL